jgi:hypothetical protein
MIGIFIVSERMNEQALQEALLDARFSGAQAEAAMLKLKALNPQLDMKKLKIGTVIMIPDEPTFKSTAKERGGIVPVGDFFAMARSGLAEAQRDTKRALAARTEERKSLAAIFRSAPFKHLLETSDILGERAGTAMKLMSQEEAQDKTDEKSLASLTKSANVELEQLTKLFATQEPHV